LSFGLSDDTVEDVGRGVSLSLVGHFKFVESEGGYRYGYARTKKKKDEDSARTEKKKKRGTTTGRREGGRGGGGAACAHPRVHKRMNRIHNLRTTTYLQIGRPHSFAARPPAADVDTCTYYVRRASSDMRVASVGVMGRARALSHGSRPPPPPSSFFFFLLLADGGPHRAT
jgi:hypothetical protein